MQTSICVALIISVLPETAGTGAQLHPHGVSPRLPFFLPKLPFFHHLTYSLDFQSLGDFGSMSSAHPSVKVHKPLMYLLRSCCLDQGIHTQRDSRYNPELTWVWANGRWLRLLLVWAFFEVHILESILALHIGNCKKYTLNSKNLF